MAPPNEMRWVVVAGVLAAATAAQATVWLGFTQLTAAPGQGVQMKAHVRATSARLRGRIVGCTGDGPCPFPGARLALDVTAYDPQAGEEVEPLGGTITLADGTTCTFRGDVWGVEVRGRRIARGALHGQVTCPTFGLATVSLWVKGYRAPLSDGR